MNIWHYDPNGGRLLGQGIADPSPLEAGVWLIPAFATTAPPPDADEGHEVIYQAGDWSQRPLPPPPEPPPPPPPPPITLTARQLFAALALTGMITEAEALAAGRTGEVLAAVEAVFATLPAQDAFLARLTWATMRDVPRNHPLIGAMIAADVATDEQVDALFALGAAIP